MEIKKITEILSLSFLLHYFLRQDTKLNVYTPILQHVLVVATDKSYNYVLAWQPPRQSPSAGSS